MKRKIFALAAGAGLVASSALVWAQPAEAAFTTRCVGEGGAVTVPGDLVVPNESVCSLTGTTITGDIRVGRGADLIMDGVSVEGQLVGNLEAYVEAVDTTVEGRINLRASFGAFLETTTVGGDVITRPAGSVAEGGFVLTDDVDIAGNVISRSGELLLENSVVEGNLNSVDSYYTDLYETWVDGNLNMRNNELGGVACAVVIGGNSVIDGNADIVQLGSDGPDTSCEGSSFWGGNVTVRNNTGGVYIDDNIVRGNLSLTGNDPVAQVGSSNRVRGDISGEFEEWAPGSVMTLSSAEPEVPADTRRESLERQIEERGSEAAAAAEAEGDANL